MPASKKPNQNNPKSEEKSMKKAEGDELSSIETGDTKDPKLATATNNNDDQEESKSDGSKPKQNDMKDEDADGEQAQNSTEKEDGDSDTLSMTCEADSEMLLTAEENSTKLNDNDPITLSDDDESNNNPAGGKQVPKEHVLPDKSGHVIDDNDEVLCVNDDVDEEILYLHDDDDLGLNDGVLDVSYDDEVVELSGDEDAASDAGGGAGEVNLVCLKRPPPMLERTVECVDILDSDEEFPVCVKAAEKVDSINIEEKTAYVKEYIENEGLGVLHSDEHGLVLFHLANVWVNGEKKEIGLTKKNIPIGTSVAYYERAFTDPEYKVLCREEVLCQAVAVWIGPRPKHLLKQVDEMSEEDWCRLEEHRRTFVLYIKGEVFTPVSFVRVRGRVKGYLSHNIGLIEVQDDERIDHTVFFTTDDIKVFKKSSHQLHDRRLQEIMPVGLYVYVDARRCHVSLDCDIRYQAIKVFAGTWPLVPHPTLLPGGAGSYAPKFRIPENEKHTFYYLELALESMLQKTVNILKNHFYKEASLRLDWSGVKMINNRHDLECWKANFDPLYGRRTRRPQNRRPRNEKMEVTHTFKAPLIRHFKTKSEFDDGSLAGNLGSSAAGSISGASSAFGRPDSRFSHFSQQSWETCSGKGSTSSINSVGVKRTWYNPDMFKFGGLRIKQEIKTEINEDGYVQPPGKRFKTEI